jgi:RND family efflux transporter MFP subunit
MSTSYSQPQKPQRSRLPVIIAIVVVLVVVIWILVARIHARAALTQQTQDDATITVTTTKLGPGKSGDELVLPGTVQAFVDAPIYARTSGYVKRWLVDIGGPVKAGDLLAELETPEVDQQKQQAEADFATATANYQLSSSTAERYKGLVASDSVSKQDADDRLGDAAAKKAQLASAKANLDRNRQLEGFKHVVAPFDGIVTARNVDIGTLVNAGGTGQELFHVADTRKLRIYVQVPQSYAAAMKPGLEAKLHFAEHPGQEYPAKLVRTANAIDPVQRTLRVELQSDNPDGALLAGGYSEVHLKLPVAAQTLRLPSNALLFRSSGMQVAVVGADNKVTLKSIKVGRDFGTEIEVVDGVTSDDTLVVNPPDSLSDGQAVRIAEPKKDDKKDGAKDAGQPADKPKEGAGK